MSLRTFILSRWWHTLLRSTICLPACFSFVTVLLFAVYDCMSIISVELCSVSFLLSVLWHYCLMSGRASRMSILKLLQQSLMVSCLPAEEVLRHSFWSRQYFHCRGLVLRVVVLVSVLMILSLVLPVTVLVLCLKTETVHDTWRLTRRITQDSLSLPVDVMHGSGLLLVRDGLAARHQSNSVITSYQWWEILRCCLILRQHGDSVFTVLVLPWSWDVVFWS